MTYPNWPERLSGKVLRSGWQRQAQDARQRRQSDAGPPGWRRRFSSAAQFVSMSLELTRDEKALFDRFFYEDVAHGARPFWMPDPTTDGWPMLDSNGIPMLDGSGQPLLMSSVWLCTFGEQIPVETIVEQVKFLKAFNVVVLP